ncbi:MAG: NDP-hexose 2,3-dehydratase family protein [Candidatus Aminicenantes bacterium]|nr:NDP-hexose 2,3-dehydratase family protein [Candidatus Aminicenantes bacterium]
MEKILKWYREQLSKESSKVEEIPFSELDKWYFDKSTGNLRHESGKFFLVEGLRITNPQNNKTWEQPIINQPEIGVLGILTKKIAGERYFLLQAKMEPGNVNRLQLSPTVQATMSNYTRVHSGKKTAFLEYFFEAPPSRILVDSLQSEQGGRFFQKRNRNIVVEIDEKIELTDNFCWVKESHLQHLLGQDNLVNMNARSVLSCYLTCADFDPANSAHRTIEITNWITNLKIKYKSEIKLMPLKNVTGWEIREDKIAHEAGKYFSIIAVRTSSDSREVNRWTQPIMKETQPGLVGFIKKKINGIDHYLVQGKIEPGNIDEIYMTPTVQCSYHNVDGNSYYRSYFLNAKPDQVKYDALLSEEGGRFYHYRNRYMVIEIDEEIESSENHKWVSYPQLLEFLRFGMLNIEARTSIACMHAGRK